MGGYWCGALAISVVRHGVAVRTMADEKCVAPKMSEDTILFYHVIMEDTVMVYPEMTPQNSSNFE